MCADSSPDLHGLRERVQERHTQMAMQLQYSVSMRVLVADDDRQTQLVVARALTSWQFDVDVASDGDAAWRILNGLTPPSLAVLDWTMPGIDGIDLCRRIREGRLRTMYVILLTAHDTRADLIRGLDAGADDYMVKPVDVEELRARVNVGVRVTTLQNTLAQRVQDLHRAHDRLREMASTDALTQLYSRRWWFDMAATEFFRSRRYHRDFSLLLLDLDHFKLVNDRFGHEQGDAVLRAFADILRRECRQSDMIGRIGGEEFALALPETSSMQARTLAERLIHACRSASIGTDAGPITWSCSIGVADQQDEDANIDALLRRADRGLYSVKRSGRNGWAQAA